MDKKSYLAPIIEEICFSSGKMAFVSGPRQAGKTTMGKQLLKQRGEAITITGPIKIPASVGKDPSQIIPKSNGSVKPLIIFDEIHKAKNVEKDTKRIIRHFRSFL